MTVAPYRTVCGHCGGDYVTVEPGQRFCSRDCRDLSLMRPEVLAVFREEAERVSARLDALAGRWALTDWERFVQRTCRWRFGIYDPTMAVQAVFVARLVGLRRQVAEVAHPPAGMVL